MDAERRRQKEMEAKAVDRAKATADAAFRPSPSVFNAPSPAVLLQQVDGPSLETYEGTESVYHGRAVPLAAGSKLNIPINVSTPGSVVEYIVELKYYDVEFSITAEREEGVTIVKEKFRFDSEESPLSQKFLVGTVPCLIQFDFSNEYSWIREKVISYKITVTPPSRESLATGRRRRAAACLKAVEDDLSNTASRLETASMQKNALQLEVSKLMKELEGKKKAWAEAEKEELWLKERKALRLEQQKSLTDRLENGWTDENGLTISVENESAEKE